MNGPTVADHAPRVRVESRGDGGDAWDRPASAPRSSRRTPPPRMGHQPGLDGLRALSVAAVIAYHAGFSWMHGGFFGVDVFFVVSGYLITALLLEERERRGSISLGQFWLRRARRLLPALAVMLVAVAVAALLIGSASEQAQLRRDLPWAIFYASNWGQILGDVPYFAGDPPLLRHLWTLAIEEQFYLLWPLAFIGLATLRRTTAAQVLVAGAAASLALAYVVHAGGPEPMGGIFEGADRTNFAYLSTTTRAGALLLGAAAAYVWRPWRSTAPAPAQARLGLLLDRVGAVALALLGCIFAVATLTDGYVYQWLLGVVAVLSTIAVVVVVHPATTLRQWMSVPALVAIGQRSYGLYLWHWPIFVFAGATGGSVARFVVAMAITIVVSELCFRYVETPVRQGALGRWWHDAGPQRVRALAGAGTVVVALGVLYVGVDAEDPAAGGEQVQFAPPPAPTSTTAAGAVPAATTTVPAPVGPRRVTIVGDSQAHSLAINLPEGIESTFAINNGAVSGCSVYDAGRVFSARESFDNSFSMCAGWQQDWAAAVTDNGSDLALVVLGAWDVFDLETADGRRLTFATPEWDAYVTANLQSGIDALVGAGARVALLESACMRPVEAEGAGVPPLPERGMDDRVAHFNDVLRAVAAQNAETTTFVEGPDAWCADEAVATDLGMRWDGVHVYIPGAALIYETIAPALLAI